MLQADIAHRGGAANTPEIVNVPNGIHGLNVGGEVVRYAERVQTTPGQVDVVADVGEELLHRDR